MGWRRIYMVLCFLPFCMPGSLFSQNLGAKEKILIVYLSRTNNTKVVAEIIQRRTGGNLVSIEVVNPYPADYRATVEQVVKENERGFLPPLKTKIADITKYEWVFIGFPTWGMKRLRR